MSRRSRESGTGKEKNDKCYEESKQFPQGQEQADRKL